jgi:hypothetical protein
MARKIIELVEITDDVTGDIIDESEADTVRFSLDGVAFKLETSKEQADGFREMFAKYIACAQIDEDAAPKVAPVRKTGPIRTRTAGPARRPGSGHTKPMVRAWAVGEGGYELGDRGRIPNEIMEAYANQHGVSVDDIA